MLEKYLVSPLFQENRADAFTNRIRLLCVPSIREKYYAAIQIEKYLMIGIIPY